MVKNVKNVETARFKSYIFLQYFEFERKKITIEKPKLEAFCTTSSAKKHLINREHVQNKLAVRDQES